MPLKRAEFTISGRVQKVGYRFLVRMKAYDHDVTGEVANLEGGTVKIVAEGDKLDIQEFLKEIRSKEYPIWVKKIQKISEENIEKRTYKDFSIARRDEEGGPKEIIDKLDLAAYYLKTSGGTIGSKIETFQKVTVSSFKDLDRKYGKVSERLAQIAKTNQDIVRANQKTARHLSQQMGRIVRTNQDTARHQQKTAKHLERLTELVEKIAEDRARQR